MVTTATKTTKTATAVAMAAAICLMLSSCAVSKNNYCHISGFPVEREAEFEKIGEICGKRYNFVREFTAYGPYFVLVTPVGSNSPSLHIYDRSDGHLVLEALPWGDGKGEVKSNWTYNFDNRTGVLSCSDFRTGRTLTMQLDSLINSGLDAVHEKPYHQDQPPINGSFQTRFGMIVFDQGSDSEDGGKHSPILELIEESGRITAKIDSLAFLNDENRWKPQIASYTAALSPNERKLALEMRGGILDIYSVGRSRLKHICTSGHIAEPDSLYSRELSEYCMEDICILGRIYATDRRIYGTYDGATNRMDVIDSMFSGGPDPSDLSRIAVYNWKGKPLELISTGREISTLYIDNKDRILYAIYWENGKQYFGQIRL